MELQQSVGTHHTGYTLFRQAIVEEDADAWATIYTRYRPLMIHWVKQCPASAWIGESSLNLAYQALARAWAALTPATFRTFAHLAVFFVKLRRCVSTELFDYTRAE